MCKYSKLNVFTISFQFVGDLQIKDDNLIEVKYETFIAVF